MSAPAHVAVIDIGKTNAKLALVETESLSEIAVRTRPNAVLPGPPWPHFDLEGHWAFILAGLKDMHRAHGIDAISITTHGAAAVLLDAHGDLAAPMLDYEHDGPDTMAAAYDAIRPAFAETGSPRLPMGLNIGAQLHWQLTIEEGLRQRAAHVLTYPQYWGHRLTGEIACDVTSLGCHTDLWNPHERRLSPLAERLGIAAQIAPPRRPDAVLGQIRSEIAAETGLRPGTEVAVGIHDSNASLLPHLLRHDPPFSVVSTGTWVIAMSVGGAPVPLDPARDTLINVNAFGDPVPSARFMGGREYEIIRSGSRDPQATELQGVLDSGAMLLPAVVNGSGPFPARSAHWIGDEPQGAARNAALAFYLALMTATCLQLAGHRGAVVVEGPFARNTGYLDMLSSATGDPVLASESQTGTSQGASLLMSGSPASAADPNPHPITLLHEDLAGYARRWKEAVA